MLNVLLRVRALGDSPVSLAAHEHGVHTEWSPVSVGYQPGPSTGARTRTWADVNVRPRPLVNTDRHKDSGKKEKIMVNRFIRLREYSHKKPDENSLTQHPAEKQVENLTALRQKLVFRWRNATSVQIE